MKCHLGPEALALGVRVHTFVTDYQQEKNLVRPLELALSRAELLARVRSGREDKEGKPAEGPLERHQSCRGFQKRHLVRPKQPVPAMARLKQRVRHHGHPGIARPDGSDLHQELIGLEETLLGQAYFPLAERPLPPPPKC